MKELDYPFNSTEIRRQGKKFKKQLLNQENLLPKRVAILSGSTVGQMKAMLELFLLNQGIQPVLYEGQYNKYYEESVFENAELSEFKPDVIYIHTTVRNIQEWPLAGDDTNQVKEKVEQQIHRFVQIWENLWQKTGAIIIQNNFEMLPYRVMGNMDRIHITGRQYFLEELNRRFVQEIQKRDYVFLNDIHYLSAYYGLENWFDDSSWYAFKYAFSPDAIPITAYNISNIVKSYFGKNKKAIVVDLDNTLWKGVIGEDGLEGIELGIETPEGMMYSEFQEYLKNVKDRGILLNVSSKNQAGAAELGFSHPSSVLKIDDVTIEKCNWNRKSENIRDMSCQLNLNTDSFVFVDDNLAEQEEVKSNIPDITVLPIREPSDMRRVLDWSGFFEVTNYSEEDLHRSDLYKENLQRETVLNTGNYEEYLITLQMRAGFAEVSPLNIDRVVQLINKTNQFNLTGLRLGKTEVEQFAKQNISICGTLFDKFGNNGLVSVILGEILDNHTVVISLWIMSCRVFKRQMEYAMFDELVRLCQNQGIDKIIGQYIRLKKNMPVAGLYRSLGFVLKETQAEKQIWEYVIPKDYRERNQVIQID